MFSDLLSIFGLKCHLYKYKLALKAVTSIIVETKNCTHFCSQLYPLFTFQCKTECARNICAIPAYRSLCFFSPFFLSPPQNHVEGLAGREPVKILKNMRVDTCLGSWLLNHTSTVSNIVQNLQTKSFLIHGTM